MDDFNITPIELLLRLWRRKFWIAAILLACLALGIAYYKTATPLYEIQANLLLEPGSRLLRLEKKEALQRDAELTATQAEVLSSWHIVSQAISSFQNGPATSPLTSEELHLILSEELTVKPIVGTRILNVSLRWDDRVQGELITEHLIEHYQEFLLKLDQGGQIDALNSLAQTEEGIRGELEALRLEFRELVETGSVLGSTDAGWALQQSQLQDLATAYTEVRGRRIGLENRIATLDIEMSRTNEALVLPASASSRSEAQVVTANYAPSGDQAVAKLESNDASSEQGWAALQMLNEIDMRSMQEPVALQQELFQAEVRRQELVEKYHAKHPELRAVNKQIADWKQRLQTLVDRAPRVLDRELRAVQMQEDRLRKLYEEELANAKIVDRQRLEQLHLQKQIEQLEVLHSSIVVQLTEMRLTKDVANEGGADLRVTVLQPPTPNIKPAWPNKKIVIGGSLLMGMLGSSMLAFIPLANRSR